MTSRAASNAGFTLAEVLAAMLFLAILIPVAVEGVLIANRAGVVAERQDVAARLADNLLTELVATDTWRDEEDTGDFGEDWPGYRWILDTEAWDEDTMRVVMVTAFFEAQGQEFSVTMSTLVEEEEDDGETEDETE